MWDYITEDLPRVLFNAFPLAEEAQDHRALDGRGHGALTIAMSFPGRFKSVSAFGADLQPHGERLGPSAIFCLSRTRRVVMGGA